MDDFNPVGLFIVIFFACFLTFSIGSDIGGTASHKADVIAMGYCSSGNAKQCRKEVEKYKETDAFRSYLKDLYKTTTKKELNY